MLAQYIDMDLEYMMVQICLIVLKVKSIQQQ